MKVLGVVTARGGSKGLPGKNVRHLVGKPLINWTIEAALGASSINSLIISTDDEEIASISRAAGARVPFVRPDTLSGDEASSVDVVIHALDQMEKLGEYYDIVVLLEPTSPLRDVKDINNAVRILLENETTSVVSVCKVECHHPSFLYSLTESFRLRSYTGVQPNNLRRQDITPLYFLDGTIYCSYVNVLRNKKSFYHDDTMAYILPKWKSLEVDDIYDFVMVEAVIRYLENQK